ncbi:hypothetical protein U1Q18_026676 [Sarracenia purpurea var. burkii]
MAWEKEKGYIQRREKDKRGSTPNPFTAVDHDGTGSTARLHIDRILSSDDAGPRYRPTTTVADHPPWCERVHHPLCQLLRWSPSASHSTQSGDPKWIGDPKQMGDPRDQRRPEVGRRSEVGRPDIRDRQEIRGWSETRGRLKILRSGIHPVTARSEVG